MARQTFWPMLFCIFFYASILHGKSLDSYMELREQIIGQENENFLGSEIELDTYESVFNEDLMSRKSSELLTGFYGGSFPPSKYFYKVKDQVDESRVFRMIRNLPKGGVLHVHDFSMVSVDWVISNVTYRDNLWMCIDSKTKWLKFGWFSTRPKKSEDCLWMNVRETRTLLGDLEVDQAFLKHLTIITEDPSNDYPDVDAAWERFDKVFGALFSLLTYEPVARDYFYQAFKEFKEDNTQYVEFRTVMPGLCPSLDHCNDRTTEMETAKILKEVAEKFIMDFPGDMCGITMIYAPPRRAMADQIAKDLDLALQMEEELGQFFAGFDLVGQEDKGFPLIDFVPVLLEKLQGSSMKLFFHAGETDWQGQSTDLNLIDALLLNTSRIGHGYAIAKHPEAKRLAIEKNVPIEVCPISNQVLGLVEDLRNHPVVPLIQESFPMVVSADDPGIWGTKGLSYDFYVAFMGMSSASMDLRLLKKLAINSLEYAALYKDAKDKCLNMFNRKWSDSIKRSVPPKVILS